MRKILGGASALALVMALSVPGQAADLTVDGVGTISDANAISVNLQSQDADQSISNEENVDGVYNGDMNFGDYSYDDQHINSNNVNSGMNAIDSRMPTKGRIHTRFNSAPGRYLPSPPPAP